MPETVTPDAELLDMLPPAIDEDDGPQQPDEQTAAGHPSARPTPTADELERIADNLINSAAKAGSMTLPLAKREAYQIAYTRDEMGLIRGVLHGLGVTAAVYDLMPGAGGDPVAAIPARPVHPALRLLTGVAVLALSTVAVRWSVMNETSNDSAGTVHPGGPVPAAGGSQSVPGAAWGFGGKNARK